MTDTRIYRTELEQPSACGGRWGPLRRRPAHRPHRPGALDHAAAQAWACSQLGPRVLPARRWNMGGRSPDLTSWYCARCSTWSHCANESLPPRRSGRRTTPSGRRRRGGRRWRLPGSLVPASGRGRSACRVDSVTVNCDHVAVPESLPSTPGWGGVRTSGRGDRSADLGDRRVDRGERPVGRAGQAPWSGAAATPQVCLLDVERIVEERLCELSESGGALPGAEDAPPEDGPPAHR